MAVIGGVEGACLLLCSLIANFTHDYLRTVINANKSRFVNEEVMLFWKLLYLQNIKTESQTRNNSRHQETLPFRSSDTVRAIYRQERPLLFPRHFAFCRLGFRMCGVLLSCLMDPKQRVQERTQLRCTEAQNPFFVMPLIKQWCRDHGL